jgi:F420-non-reducing hydrogenase iron-sulfur subunit
MDDFEPEIVAFSCKWCSSDLASMSGMKCYPGLEVVMTCSCKADEVLVLKAFASGADGVLIDKCFPGECCYMKDNLSARRRMVFLAPLLEAVGLGSQRLRLEPSSPMEGTVLADRLGNFAQTIRELGPSPFSKKVY